MDYAVPKPQRREWYGDERRSATTKDLPSTTRCWTKVTMRAVARKKDSNGANDKEAALQRSLGKTT